MKKTLWLALILLLVCVFAFSACDSGDTSHTPNDTPLGTSDNTTESETDAHVHAFGEWTTVKDATCTVKGEQERSCSCGEKETQSIDALGHTEVIDAAVVATCTTDGKTEGKHCSVCSETLIAQNNIPASHTEGEWIIDTNATCTEDGSKHQVCAVCSTPIKTEKISATGHTDGAWVTDTNATCTVDGSKHQVCSVCNASIKTEAIAATGHTDGEWVVDTNATCTEDGSKHQVCSVCNASIKTEAIAATGHTDGEWVVDTDATCTEDGSKHQVCSVCNASIKTEAIAATGHADGEWVVDTDATCTVDGTKHQECAVCSASIKTGTIAATGHSIDVITSPTTCIQVGYDEYQCKKCDYSETKQWNEMSCSVSLDYIGSAYLAQGYCYAYTLTVNIVGGGSENFEADAVVVIHDIYGSNISTIYPATYIGYEGSWSTSQTIYLLANWYHTIFVNIDTTTGYGFACYYDVSSGTYSYDYDSLHKYDSIVTAPTKTDEGYTTHTCSVCGDSYVDTYTDAIGSMGLSYVINDDGTTCTITGIGTCEDEDIYIPAYIDGYKVTTIGEKVFENLAHIKSIHISKTVTDIANKAFYKCTGITEIRIPETVKRIGSQIFLGCDSLNTVYYDSSYAPPEGETFMKSESIKKIVFGENLTTIPDYICYNCDNLEEIILSPNTKYIGSYAFYYCQSVEKIDLPEGLINTGWYAFYEMNITEIIIPNSVESIYNSFRGCRKLEKIVMPVSVISIPNQTFYLCYSIKEVYYMGDELEWSSISISENSAALKEATVYYYSEMQPTNNGNYWHYVDGVPTAW